MTKLPNQFLSKWINFWVFVFCLAVLFVDGHGGEAVVILSLTMVCIFITSLNGVFFINDDKSKYKLNGNEIIFITLVILFWLSNLYSTLYQPEGLQYESSRMALRAIDNPMRWLLMLPIFFLLRRYKLNWKVIPIGLSIGALISVVIAIHEVYFLGDTRASGGMNHEISFGELMVAVDLLLWVFMIFAWNNNHKLLAAILLVASLVAFYGSILSVTRGAWLAYVFSILSFLVYSIKRSIFNKQNLLSKPMLLRISLSLILFLLVSQTDQYQTIENRTVTIFSEVSQGNYEHTSDRMKIFKTAIEINRHFPFGVGTDNFRNGGKAAIILDSINNDDVVVKKKDGSVLDNNDLKSIRFKVTDSKGKDDIHYFRYLQSFNKLDGSLKLTSRYRHAHNEWLNVLAENGYPGFILLTLLFAFPLIIFWQNLSNESELVAMYSYCGILLVVSFAIFGQTQSIFTSHAVLIFFIFFLFLFIAQISRLSNTDDNHDSTS